MLNKNAEKVLKCIIKKSGGNLNEIIEISRRDFKDKEISKGLLTSICFQLNKEGYISRFSPNYDEEDYGRLLLSHNGYSYFDNKRTLSFKTWTPIIISLVALIKSFLPELTYLTKSIVQLLKTLKGS